MNIPSKPIIGSLIFMAAMMCLILVLPATEILPSLRPTVSPTSAPSNFPTTSEPTLAPTKNPTPA